MFSKACEYGIRAVLYIAEQSQIDRRPNITEIAKAVDSPEPFTAKICQQLARDKIILSKKGPNGGFYLDKNSKMKLADIVISIDGNSIFENCGLGLPQCSDAHPCPVHHQFMEVREKLQAMCQENYIMDMATSLNKGNSYLKL